MDLFSIENLASLAFAVGGVLQSRQNVLVLEKRELHKHLGLAHSTGQILQHIAH
jgi:hypothetical protein